MSMKALPVLCCTPGSAPLGVDERGELAARFKALADPTRVAILSMLSCEEEVCVCVLTDQLEVSQPTISHHLKILREAGLVDSTRRGTWAFYRLVPDALEELRSALAPDRALATA
jgi:ArsR family transcriptional regulator, arsenate/arsenite/antimonite-responsive transcriptional repressor